MKNTGILLLLVFTLISFTIPAYSQITNLGVRLSTEKVDSADDELAAAMNGPEIPKSGFVNVFTYLNVRTGSSTDEQIVGRLNRNNKVDILDEKNGWYKIKWKNSSAWVSGKYINRSETKTSTPGWVDVNSALNVRGGPSTSNGVKGILRKNDQVEIIGSSNGWYQIKYKGGTAWVSSRYVQTGTPVIDSTPTQTTDTSTTSDTSKPTNTNKPVNGVLNVPARTQFSSKNVVNGVDYRRSWCGPEALGMVLEYNGIKKSSYELAKMAEYTFQSRTGTPIGGIVNGAKKAGFKNTKLHTNKSMSWLESQIKRGKPVIVNVDVRWKGHYIVVTGFKNGQVMVNDPGKGALSRVKYGISKEAFWSYWSSKSRRAVVVE